MHCHRPVYKGDIQKAAGYVFSRKDPATLILRKAFSFKVPLLDDPDNVSYAGRAKLRFGLVVSVGSGVLQQQVQSSSAGLNAFPVANDQLAQTRDGRVVRHNVPRGSFQEGQGGY